jgi:ubiquitin-like 1-activating enzyme E1 A
MLISRQRAEAAIANIQRLNNRVKVESLSQDITALPDQAGFLAQYQIVIATDLPSKKLVAIDDACRKSNVKFYAAASDGFYGFIFADLIRHEFVVERDLSNIGTLIGPEAGSQTRTVVSVNIHADSGKRIERVTKEEIYSPFSSASKSLLPTPIRNVRRRLRAVTPLLSCFRAIWEMEATRSTPISAPLSSADMRRFIELATRNHKELGIPDDLLTAELMRKFTDNLGSQLAPITAILGGLVAQDAINVIGCREQPIQNLAIFDGETFQVPVYAMHDEKFGYVSNGAPKTNGTTTAANAEAVIVL